MIRLPLRARLPGFAAFLWGCVVFMPVGANYAAAVLTLFAVLAAGHWHERLATLRRNPLRWPVGAFIVWVVLVLAVRPHHAETALSMWHDARIFITLLLALVLSRAEAIQAVRGFLFAAAFALLCVLLTRVFVLPNLSIWHNVATMDGNKSINDALLFALLGASSLVYGLDRLGNASNRHWAVPALGLAVAMAAVVALALPSRTSLLGLVAALFGACLHQWRDQPRRLFVAVGLSAAVTLALLSQVASVQQKFDLGLQEVQAAELGKVSEGSWTVRFYMYRETARMMMEKPLAGWGLGSWTPLWHERGPPLLHDYSMPHNDFLWLGSETGLPGALILASILVTALVVSWRRKDATGRLAFVAVLIMFIATGLNSAFRDAAIGLNLPWVVFVYVRLVQEPGPAWREILPPRAQETANAAA